MGKRFQVLLKQTITIDFEGEKATGKSAAYVAENIARCHFKEGYSKSIAGKFFIQGEMDAEASDVREIVDKR